MSRASTIGATGAAMTTPLFGPNVKPRYGCTSDSVIHVVVSADLALALDAILSDSKNGVVFWTHS